MFGSLVKKCLEDEKKCRGDREERWAVEKLSLFECFGCV